MSKGSITIEDAQIVHEFANHVQPVLRHNDCNKLLEAAKTVARISYCCIADARYRMRAERAQQPFSSGYPTEVRE